MVKYTIFSNVQIVTEKNILKKMGVVVADKKIHAIIPNQDIKKFPDAELIEFPENYFLVPGFIDMHVHGANGSDVMDATSEALSTISAALAKEGTTAFLATTMTAGSEKIEATLKAVNSYMREQEKTKGAKILGVHLEGPFLSPKKVGAQRADDILLPKKEYIEKWQKLSDNVIKLVTLAPELTGSELFIKYLVENNIIASIGHTDATYAQTMSGVDAGATHATHLFNAMRGIHQREPGAVTAILLSEKVMAELILDGVHLDPAIVRLVLKLKGKEKIILVTDAMRAKCLRAGVYDLGGQAVTVEDDVASLADGTLAGSVLKMNSALKNFMEFTGASLVDAIECTSLNPARALGIDKNTGSIAEGKNADLVVLDEQFNVVLTMCEGSVVNSICF